MVVDPTERPTHPAHTGRLNTKGPGPDEQSRRYTRRPRRRPSTASRRPSGLGLTRFVRDRDERARRHLPPMTLIEPGGVNAPNGADGGRRFERRRGGARRGFACRPDGDGDEVGRIHAASEGGPDFRKRDGADAVHVIGTRGNRRQAVETE